MSLSRFAVIVLVATPLFYIGPLFQRALPTPFAVALSLVSALLAGLLPALVVRRDFAEGRLFRRLLGAVAVALSASAVRIAFTTWADFSTETQGTYQGLPVFLAVVGVGLFYTYPSKNSSARSATDS